MLLGRFIKLQGQFLLLFAVFKLLEWFLHLGFISFQSRLLDFVFNKRVFGIFAPILLYERLTFVISSNGTF